MDQLSQLEALGNVVNLRLSKIVDWVHQCLQNEICKKYIFASFLYLYLGLEALRMCPFKVYIDSQVSREASGGLW